MSDKADKLLDLIKHYQEIIDLYEPLVLEARENLSTIRKAIDLVLRDAHPTDQESLFDDNAQRSPGIGRYADKTLAEAIKDILTNNPRPLTAAEITRRAIDGGFTSNSADKRRDVSVCLSRLKKRSEIGSDMTDEGMVYRLAKGGEQT